MYQNPYPEKNTKKKTNLKLVETPKKNLKKKAKKVSTMPPAPVPAPVVNTAPGPTLKELVAKITNAVNGQYTRIEEIDPSLAKVLLEGNTTNRTISEKLVLSLARDIKDGKWIVTHQGIALGSDGRLYDGQHRLHAIIQAGKTVQMAVTYNVDPAAFNVIDVNNRPRSHADVMRLTHEELREPNVRTTTVNGALKVIARFGGTPSAVRWTTSELSNMLALFGKDVLAVHKVMGSDKKLNKSAFLGAFSLAYPVNPEFVTKFLETLRSRVGLSENQAALIRASERERSGHGSDQSRAKLALLALRALRAEAAGQQLTKLFLQHKDIELSEDSAVRFWLHQRKLLNLPDIPAVAHADKDEE